MAEAPLPPRPFPFTHPPPSWPEPCHALRFHHLLSLPSPLAFLLLSLMLLPPPPPPFCSPPLPVEKTAPTGTTGNVCVRRLSPVISEAPCVKRRGVPAGTRICISLALPLIGSLTAPGVQSRCNAAEAAAPCRCPALDSPRDSRRRKKGVTAGPVLSCRQREADLIFPPE